ncbi:MAG: flavin reductase family protein [Methanobacteriota archaeon]|nr:MAG: flavin reductase family protein [Euryarchaeota archaeon]
MEREASKAGANAVWPRETRGGEQAHHPEGDASAASSRRIDLNEWTADEAFAHDLISHRVVRRAGGAMDKKVKKKILQQIPYGAYIVGTQTEDGKDWLMFGTWLMQTSFKPTLVAFAFRKDSRTLANVRRSKSFAVSFIREGTQDVAELVLDGAFEKVKTERTTSGLPVLSDGAGWIECHVVNQIPEGDHPIVLAEVADVGPGKGKPIFLESLGWHYGG